MTVIWLSCDESLIVIAQVLVWIILYYRETFTFSLSFQEGQLGREADDADDNSWNMIPGPISLPGDSCQAKWVSASGNQTFIAVDESLISENTLTKCQIFAHPECFGKFIVYSS